MNTRYRPLGLLGAAILLVALVLTAVADHHEPLEDPIPNPIPSGFLVELETLTDGLTAPNWGISAPGACQAEMNRLYVVDQVGILWAIDLATGDKHVYADVTDRLVELGVAGPGTFDERGFLGVAFEPGFAQNGLLYTYTSEPVAGEADFSTMPVGESANHQAVILEWQVPDPCDPDSVVDADSVRELLRVDEPQFNHNGGAVNFGHDGHLYIAFGDGGGRDDEGVGHGDSGNGQDASNVLGTILRIDPSGSNSANGQYGIPADNPFVGQADHVDEIFAYGFRNPFRFSFDMVGGALYAADVGQGFIEEVDLVEAGGNYGWNLKEGSFCFDPNGDEAGFVYDCDINGGLIDPIAEYDHDEGVSVIGGFVYRGNDLKHLNGRYIFGDWNQTFFANNGRLFYLDKNGDLTEFQIPGQEDLGISLNGFGQDAHGELYALGNLTGTPFGETGVVLKLTRPLYEATLSGDQEVIPVATDASGQARLVPSVDGSRLKVFIKVRHLQDALAAHIHCAPAGENGPVGVTLFSGGPVSIESGFLVRDVFTEPDAGNGCGWETLADVIDALASGDTYINIHTLANPPGEIRGQIE